MPLKLSPTQIAFNARGDGTFSQPFKEQVDFFRKKLNQPTKWYDDILKSAHDRAFVVAGATKADLLADFNSAIDQAISQGKGVKWFKKEFENIVKKHGWEGWTGSDTLPGRDWRARVIYNTNIQASYNAGRYAQLTDPDLLKIRPYWKYIHDDRVGSPRPLHESWDGTVLRYDDPWWKTHFTPNGYGCRCRIASASTREYKGHPAPDDGTWEKTDRNGVVHVLPKGVDYGWDYAPGSSVISELKPFIEDKVATLPKLLGDAFKSDISQIHTYWKSGTDQAEWHDKSFALSPEFIKNAIKAHDNDFRGLINNKNSGAYHFNGSICMGNIDKNNYHGQGIWRHEYGHFIDYRMSQGLGYRSAASDFTSAMASDSRAIINASGFGRAGKATDAIRAERSNKYQAIANEIIALTKDERIVYLTRKAESQGLLLTDIEAFFNKETIYVDDILARYVRIAFLIEAIGSKDAAAFMDAIAIIGDWKSNNMTYKKGLLGKFSDLIGSATKNKLLGHGPHGNGGHSNSYLKRPGAAESEVFANLTTLLGSDSLFWHKTIEAFYPILTKLYKDILNGN